MITDSLNMLSALNNWRSWKRFKLVTGRDLDLRHLYWWSRLDREYPHWKDH